MGIPGVVFDLGKMTLLPIGKYLAGWWFGCHFFPHRLGISSSQLTFIFFRGVAQPPTSWKNTWQLPSSWAIFPHGFVMFFGPLGDLSCRHEVAGACGVSPDGRAAFRREKSACRGSHFPNISHDGSEFVLTIPMKTPCLYGHNQPSNSFEGYPARTSSGLVKQESG